jgi:dihydroflavonol-4-reductase
MEPADANVLITGASGSLGRQLAYEMTGRGARPIAHVRQGSDTVFLDSLGLEKRIADITVKSQLPALVAGVDAVIHTAAWVDFRKNRLSQFAGINTIGAVDLYHAAAAAGVRRFVHVSSVVAVGAMPRIGQKNGASVSERRVSETSEFNLGHLRIPYVQTKRAAELELMKRAAEGGPELVVVNPSIIVSPSPGGHDRERVRSAFSHFVAPDYPYLVNLVDVRDLARGILCALERGTPGERYVMAGDNISVRDLMLSVSWLVGQAPHLINIPRPVIDTAAHVSCLWQTITSRPRVSFYPDLVKLMDYDWVYSSLKARNELGYRTRSIQETLHDYLTDTFTGSFARPLGGILQTQPVSLA